MPDETGGNTPDNNATNNDDIIKQQTNTISTLTDQLKQGGSGIVPPQIIYTQEQKKNGQPNFILIGALIVAVYWVFFRKKR